MDGENTAEIKPRKEENVISRPPDSSKTVIVLKRGTKRSEMKPWR